MKRTFASDLWIEFINEQYEKVATISDHRNRTRRNAEKVIPFAEALETVAYDNDLLITPNKKTMNLGDLVEATIKAYLDKGNAVAKQGESDLITGGKRFDIKAQLVGYTSKPATLNLETKDDVLFISNQGVYILRNEKIKLAKSMNLLNPENRFRNQILNSELVETTDFTKRLTLELGLGRNA